MIHCSKVCELWFPIRRGLINTSHHIKWVASFVKSKCSIISIHQRRRKYFQPVNSKEMLYHYSLIMTKRLFLCSTTANKQAFLIHVWSQIIRHCLSNCYPLLSNKLIFWIYVKICECHSFGIVIWIPDMTEFFSWKGYHLASGPNPLVYRHPAWVF